ncbi:hypothetical protein ACHAO7_007288 [Fusarium culmorum]
MISDHRNIFYRLLKCKDGLWTAGPLSAEINEHIFFYREFVRDVTDTQKTYRSIKYRMNTQVEAVRVSNTYTRNRINGSNNKNHASGADDENYSNDPNFTNGFNDESHTDDSSNSAQAPISRVEQEQDDTDNLLLTRAAEDVCALLRTANHSARNHPVPRKSIDIFEKLFRRQIVDEEGAKAVAKQCVALWNHDCPLPAISALARSVCNGALGQIDEEAYLARTLIYNCCTLYEIIGSIADHNTLALKAYLLATKTVDKPHMHDATKQEEGVKILDTMLNVQNLQIKSIDETREADRARVPDLSELLDKLVSHMGHPYAVERAKEILASQGVRHDRTMGRVADMIKTGREGSTTLRETLAGHSDKCEDSDESDESDIGMSEG